jgi:plasmid maintenance system killer protein
MDFSGIDYKDPASFFAALQAGGSSLPIPKMISPGQVKKQAIKRSIQIFKDWELLKAILDRHEATIHKRWTKKTKNQRVKILLAGWPNMSVSHRPHNEAFREENEHQREASTKFREAYLWPYINLEDLSKPKTLPLFLQTRGRNTPDAFAIADQDAAHLGYVTKAIVPVFLNEYTMMFTNRKTPEKYGELLSWDDNDDAFHWLMSGKGMHPGQGLLILEIQERILRFLVDCCKCIMHDVPDLTSDKYPVQPPVVLTRETANGYDTLALMAAEAPYRLPASMDLERLESLIAAKKSATEDRIWALREDPGYFADAVLEYREHRQELLKDTRGQKHPLFTTGQEDIFWARVINNVVGKAHMQLENWSELESQVKGLRTLQDKYRDKISIEKDLPDEYLNALLKFQHYLKQSAKGVSGDLKHCAASSPPLLQFFERMPPQDPTSPMIQIRGKQDVAPDKTRSQLIWLLETLWDDGNSLFLIRLTNAVDELNRFIQSDPKAKAFISSYVADAISDISVISEATRQLEIYQPWAQTFEDLMVKRKGAIQSEFAESTKGWGLVLKATGGPDQKKIVQLGQPEDRKFYYPVEKRRTKENVEAMRSAERNLDAFWSIVDKSMRTRFGNKLQGTALWQLLSRSNTLQRTPEWVDKDKQATAQITKPLSDIYFDLEQRTERTVDRSSRSAKAPAEKKKTRGVPGASATATAAAQAADEHLDKHITYQLDPRALKVFRTLFYTPDINATPGEVAWTDFLHAMVSAGFSAQKLGGSAWQFKPLKLDVERPIQFHDPHPSGKLAYKLARLIGRRLNHAYGWAGNMFVPKLA